jgi:hypothetical protein
MSTSLVKVNLDALNDVVGAMEEDVMRAARPVAQVGAEVLYRAVKRNVQALGHVTGNLERAIYQAFVEKQSGPGHAVYDISWNPRKAPHGYVVENGHIQRYAVHLGKNGHWYTLVRPEAKGRPKPRRNATQAERDAYYVLRDGGPKQVPAKAFVRSAASAIPAAEAAMEAKFFEELGNDF